MTLDLAGIAGSVAQVLVVGLLFGAGLPALFALGLRSLASAAGELSVADGARAPRPNARYVAYLCFGAAVVVALLGVVVIVFGKQIFGGH